VIRLASCAFLALAGAPRLVGQSERGSLHPVWSPDGKWIVFESPSDGDFEIYLISADGGPPKQLTRNAVHDRMPQWSRDGRTIRFVQGMHDAARWLEVPVGGGEPRPISQPVESSDSVTSADGAVTAYVVAEGRAAAGRHGGPAGLWLRAGSRAPRRVSPPGQAEEPRLSPDAAWLVFEHRRPGDRLEESRLFLVSTSEADEARPLTVGTNPSWSPDGRSIVYKSWDVARKVLVISTIDPRTSQVRHLSPGVLPSWSPDGRRILFMTERNGRWEIVNIAPDGTGARCLTCKAGPGPN
jgi:TolB protein